ncbi:MAG: sulfotransferase family protein [Pirellulales bacterium]
MKSVKPLGGKWAAQTPTVVVSGLPRSGTSMMMQMLAAGGLPVLSDGVREPDHDNPRGYYELEAVKRTRQDPSWLTGSEGKVVKIIHALITDLPTDRPYRVVMMRRKAEVVLKSQAAMLERLGNAGADLAPERLAEIYEQQLQQVMDYMNRQSCFEFIEVWYGAIVEYTRTQVERIDRFLSGELDIEAMVAAVDPSLRRN